MVGISNIINRTTSLINSRIGRQSLLQKVVKAEELESLLNIFQNGQYMGWSGFAGTSYPKVIPTLLADHVEKNNLQGKLQFNLFVGASAGIETEDRWAKLNMIDRRYPHQSGKNIRSGINSDRIRFADEHLSIFANDLLYGFYTLKKEKGNKRKMDIVVIEATEITEDGGIVPGASVGITPELLEMADKVIIEINTSLPSFKGIHDLVAHDPPPYTKPYQITRVDDRIGKKAFYCDPEKIIAIVESQLPDMTSDNSPEDEVSTAIANHIVQFFDYEISQGRLPKNLLPLQSGIGSVANAVIGGLSHGPFDHLTVWTEVIQDTFLDFFDNGKLQYASATSLRFSQGGFNRLFNNWDSYKNKFMLRNQSISNSAELIRRLGVIAMNTPVEFDIYGHINSTCVDGTKMLNGLGGSGEFLRNSYISIVHAPSVRPSRNDPLGISSVVPFCSHVDHSEHDIDIIVTEQGLADLRGLSPKERALEIISKCAHPIYKPILMEYFIKSHEQCLKTHSSHEPHQLSKAFKLHENLLEKGTMRIDKW
ncbi:acetyl-coA hydrolase [Tieghemostelium lacteum]|uniref:Acetyl-CoA hydrolase n=1 Tax=Tieghemostelium lacteum TaxID=361077 RepID=A0A151ZGZ6_TIELA|nr:acetyl-coA hydrolase [Tieghemostelium lacteum]|eukprot:KYQ93251.1 acetyl-coA hydrolase [Tieghemostelium lacteum]